VENITAKIASSLKSLRHQRGWSLQATSEKTGVSKTMLGQIERGESSPTISILWKIANGFEVSFSSLVDDPLATPCVSEHRYQSPQPMNSDSQITITPLFSYDKQLSFEIFIIELQPGCQHTSSSHRDGVIEHVIVIQGTISIFADDRWYDLHRNEALRFNASQSHAYRNISSEKATFYNLIHYPRST
jgi:transcriptional regulator with XRE-family HTH domain